MNKENPSFLIQIMFIQIPLALDCRNLFSFSLHSKRLAKNPLFEAISLHGPTGPLGNKTFLVSRFFSELKPPL
jgi:hypothetical protein